jgi:hypothetical protein
MPFNLDPDFFSNNGRSVLLKCVGEKAIKNNCIEISNNALKMLLPDVARNSVENN